VILGRYTPEEIQVIEDREASRGSGGRRRDAGEDRRRRVAKSRGDDVEDTEVEDAEVEDTAEDTDAADTEVEDTAEDTDVQDTEVDEVDDTDVEDTEDTAPETAAGPTVDELVADNTKDELLALADEAGVQVAKSANKATIAEAIVAGSEGTDEGDA
jgi:hypothetical protein